MAQHKTTFGGVLRFLAAVIIHDVVGAP